MDVNKLILDALQYAIEAGIALLVPIVIRYVLTKISKTNLEKASIVVAQVVKATEQTLGAGNGANKKAAVEEKLAALLKGKISAEQIDVLIECAVHELGKDVKAELDKAE